MIGRPTKPLPRRDENFKFSKNPQFVKKGKPLVIVGLAFRSVQSQGQNGLSAIQRLSCSRL